MGDLGCRLRPVSWQRTAAPRKAFGWGVGGGEQLTIRVKDLRARAAALASRGSGPSAAICHQRSNPHSCYLRHRSISFTSSTGLDREFRRCRTAACRVVGRGVNFPLWVHRRLQSLVV